MLEVNNVSLALRRGRSERTILQDVSFSVAKGETVGIVGESGCGKSLTALSIMRLLPEGAKLSGDIRLGDTNLANCKEAQLQRIRGKDMAMIFQDPLTSLNPLHTVGRQIQEMLQLHTSLGKAERKARAAELLRQVGLPRAEELLQEYPHQLSGGMRQRVMIAMAVACEPKLLICDEPTTALDVTVQAQILDVMNKLKAERDMGMIFITHDLGVVAETCDRVIVMYAGRVVETGRTEEIFRQPQHPYTIGLLNSIPKIGQRKTPLGSIPGTVPSPDNMPPGCRFADRCRQRMDICTRAVPPLAVLSASQSAACFLHGEVETHGPSVRS